MINGLDCDGMFGAHVCPPEKGLALGGVDVEYDEMNGCSCKMQIYHWFKRAPRPRMRSGRRTPCLCVFGFLGEAAEMRVGGD